MSGSCYVYILLDPRKNGQPFYVGKGVGERWKDHFKERYSKCTNPRRRRIIHDCRRKGLEVGMKKWAEGLTHDEAFLIEEELIRRFGRYGYDKGGILANIRTVSRPPRRGANP